MSEKQRLHIERLAQLRRGKECSWMKNRNYKVSDETKKLISLHNKGKTKGIKRDPESIKKGADKLKLRHKEKQFGFPKGFQGQKGKFGDKNSNWRGGKLSEKRLLREDPKYKMWRKQVYERDNYVCQECGCKSNKEEYVYLEAHHIKPFATFPELRFDIDNGITLCKKCHDRKPKGVKIYEQNNLTQL